MKGKIALIALVILSLAAYAPATCFIDFITESVPIQHVGVATNFQFQVCCGTPAYTFSVASGSLPPGLSLSSTGKITGTPTTAGYYTVCILLTDSVGCHLTQCFEVNVE